MEYLWTVFSKDYTFSDYLSPYIWKVKSDWSRIIQKWLNGEMRYCIGSSDYATNWTNRASLTYVLYDEL